MLTQLQKELADLLFNTKTKAKVRRRKQNSNGNMEFYYLIRDTSPVDFRIDPSEFAFVHHEQNPEAPLSPIIINLRNMPENLNKKIAEVMAEVEIGETPDFCTGVPNAAPPFAKEYSNFSGIPYLTLFEKDDVPGKPRILPTKDAPRGKGKTVLIVDDVITKGASKFRAFKVAEELGYKVLGLIVLVDREEGGKEVIEEAGYKFYAPLKITDLLDYYFDKKMITKKQYEESLNYLKQSRI